MLLIFTACTASFVLSFLPQPLLTLRIAMIAEHSLPEHSVAGRLITVRTPHGVWPRLHRGAGSVVELITRVGSHTCVSARSFTWCTTKCRWGISSHLGSAASSAIGCYLHCGSVARARSVARWHGRGERVMKHVWGFARTFYALLAPFNLAAKCAASDVCLQHCCFTL